jgi:hypothetical protein
MKERTTVERMESFRKSIEENGKQFRGRKELLIHLDGERLTQKQAIIAKCYDCMGYYEDKDKDCGIEQCPLYPFMVYRGGEKRSFKARSKKLVTEDT